MEKGEKALSIIKRPNLTGGQTDLYDLVVSKLKDDAPITFMEAKSIYLTKVCRDIRNGIPYYWNAWKRNEAGETVGGAEPMTEYDLTRRVLLWITANIGALVLKGYLKVIPMIELDTIN